MGGGFSIKGLHVDAGTNDLWVCILQEAAIVALDVIGALVAVVVAMLLAEDVSALARELEGRTALAAALMAVAGEASACVDGDPGIGAVGWG